MTDTNTKGTLVSLSDSPLTVANPDDDVRGRKVVDKQGDEVGKVDDLLIDDADRRVRFLKVAHGGFLGIGEDHFLVPVDAVTGINDERVQIDRTRSDLSNAPGYNPELAKAPAYYPGLYGWWGYAPYWTGGYRYPAYPIYPV